MFSILFTRVMSRVTHSEPGLPMLCQEAKYGGFGRIYRELSQGAHTSSVSVYVRNIKKCMGEY